MKKILILAILFLNILPSFKDGHFQLISASTASAQCGGSTGEEQHSGGINLNDGSNNFDPTSLDVYNTASSDPGVLANEVYAFLNQASPPGLPDYTVTAGPNNMIMIVNQNTNESWWASSTVLQRALNYLDRGRSNIINTSEYSNNWQQHPCGQNESGDPNDPNYDPWLDPDNPLLSQTAEGRGGFVMDDLQKYYTIDDNPYANDTTPDENEVENGISTETISPFVIPVRMIAKTTNRGNTEDMTHGFNGDSTGLKCTELFDKPNWYLENEMSRFFFYGTILGSNAMKDASQHFMDNFFSGNPTTPFEDPAVNAAVAESSAMGDFLRLFGADLNTKLAAASWNIDNVSNFVIGNYRPIFGGWYNKTHGLTALLNDTEETDIQLKDYVYLGNGKWEVTVQVTIFDHFGLDKPDMLKKQDWPLIGCALEAWWLLQHRRDYKPFETRVTVFKRIHN